MTLLLTLEHAPRPQDVRQMRLERGALVIGRAADADWRIDDTDMYVSRAHCTVAAGPSGFAVTDTSSSGLYIDQSQTPLGAGNSAPLRDGMRLRLGDYVVRVELEPAAAERETPPSPDTRRASPHPAAERQTPSPAFERFDTDGFFSTPVQSAKSAPRPATLPDPFDEPVSTPRMEASRHTPPLLDDPFTLDPAATPPVEPGPVGPIEWDDPPRETPKAAPAAPQPRDPPPAARAAPTAPAQAGGAGARDAFLRGLGLHPEDWPAGDTAAEMEALGRAHRLMVEGYMHLLRKRAEEKAGARIATTIVGGSEVNPLKFMPTAEDALAMMLGRRSPGFLDADAAITGAIRDLAQHHVSAWRGVQGALSRMLDRFDPGALEAELKELSRIETLLSGGRRAKLWALYEERYREIARNAESRFLGEIGADFRDAYEGKGD